MLIELVVKDKRIYRTGGRETLVSDNGDYRVHFTFDEEWDGKIKIARFVNGQGYSDALVDDDGYADIPVHMLTPYVLTVGVYASGMHATVPFTVRCDVSILTHGGVPAPPNINIFDQILAFCEYATNKYDEICEKYERLLENCEEIKTKICKNKTVSDDKCAAHLHPNEG